MTGWAFLWIRFAAWVNKGQDWFMSSLVCLVCKTSPHDIYAYLACIWMAMTMRDTVLTMMLVMIIDDSHF